MSEVFLPAQLEAFEKSVSEIAGPLGTSPDRILEDLNSYLQQRLAVLLASQEKNSQKLKMSFFRCLFGRDPEESDLALMSKRSFRIAIPNDVQLYLLRLQLNRCASCGIPITQQARPHVDHKRPIALGGSNEVENLQILCINCNLGKKAFLGWPLSAPHFELDKNTYTVRYFVLSRARHRCQVPDCTQDVTSTQLTVHLRIPIKQGGRWILDNLLSYCQDHYADRTAAIRLRSPIKPTSTLKFPKRVPDLTQSC